MVTKRLVWVVAGMLGCLGFGAVPARGTVLVYEFEGVVDSVVDFGYILTQYVQIGDTISGTVTVERDLPDLFPNDDNAGRYEGAVIAVNGQVGDLTFTLDTAATSVVEIVNDAPPLSSSFPGPWDRYSQGADLWMPQIAEVMWFSFGLMDFSGAAFDAAMGDAIPQTMPPIDAFLDNDGLVHPFGVFGGGTIGGEMTLIRGIPEPGTATTFLLGMALASRRKRSVLG